MNIRSQYPYSGQVPVLAAICPDIVVQVDKLRQLQVVSSRIGIYGTCTQWNPIVQTPRKKTDKKQDVKTLKWTFQPENVVIAITLKKAFMTKKNSWKRFVDSALCISLLICTNVSAMLQFKHYIVLKFWTFLTPNSTRVPVYWVRTEIWPAATFIYIYNDDGKIKPFTEIWALEIYMSKSTVKSPPFHFTEIFQLWR